MQLLHLMKRGLLGLGPVICILFHISATAAKPFQVLYSFGDNGSGDGKEPVAGLLRDEGGSFFGTTFYGGNSGKGTVYKLTPEGTETVLYSFGGG